MQLMLVLFAIEKYRKDVRFHSGCKVTKFGKHFYPPKLKILKNYIKIAFLYGNVFSPPIDSSAPAGAHI